jgi:hypothetical protein
MLILFSGRLRNPAGSLFNKRIRYYSQMSNNQSTVLGKKGRKCKSDAPGTRIRLFSMIPSGCCPEERAEGILVPVCWNGHSPNALTSAFNPPGLVLISIYIKINTLCVFQPLSTLVLGKFYIKR